MALLSSNVDYFENIWCPYTEFEILISYILFIYGAMIIIAHDCNKKTVFLNKARTERNNAINWMYAWNVPLKVLGLFCAAHVKPPSLRCHIYLSLYKSERYIQYIDAPKNNITNMIELAIKTSVVLKYLDACVWYSINKNLVPDIKLIYHELWTSTKQI